MASGNGMKDYAADAMPLSDLDRRTIANLAIPRNVPNLSHELRIDPFTKTREDADVNAHLEYLKDRGFVHNLGEQRDPAKVAAHLPKRVRQMADDQSEVYVKRMSQPRHAWRMEGDLWIITNEGIDKLKEPTVESPPMTPTQVQSTVDSEWARTMKGVTAENFMKSKYVDDPAAAGMLLEDEFLYWFKLVADDCAQRWGDHNRPHAPMAGGAGWTDTYENLLIDAENQKTALGAVVDPWFMCLSILAFSDTDTGTIADDGTHKPTYTGYARASTPASSLAVASAGSSANTTAITFAACTALSSTIVAFGNCSALTVGVLRKYGTCASTTVSTTQTPATFAIGAYTTTAD
jgi:hypothetical protein